MKVSPRFAVSTLPLADQKKKKSMMEFKIGTVRERGAVVTFDEGDDDDDDDDFDVDRDGRTGSSGPDVVAEEIAVDKVICERFDPDESGGYADAVEGEREKVGRQEAGNGGISSVTSISSSSSASSRIDSLWCICCFISGFGVVRDWFDWGD
jgi:hypothetical protein